MHNTYSDQKGAGTSGDSALPANATNEAYRPLQIAFAHYNEHLFAKVLGTPVRPVLFTYQRVKRTYGYFHSKRFSDRDGIHVDELAVNPEYFAVSPLTELLQTLVHEMAHSWQLYFGKPSRRSYHNKDFANIMRSIGLQVSDTGKPGGAQVGQCMAEYPIAGGPFHEATKLLMATGFSLVWYDRFPPKGAKPGVPIGSETPLEMQSDPEMAAAMTIAATDSPRMELQHSDSKKNRSNRSKYRCPCDAKTSVWGKPGLKVICGICMKHLVEIDATDDSITADDSNGVETLEQIETENQEIFV